MMKNDAKFKLDAEFEEMKRTIEKPNVLLVGGTGVGKSSLLNLCFGEQFAQTGIGKPVTEEIQKFSKPDFPVVIYDTKGYEVGSAQEKDFLDKVVGFCVSCWLITWVSNSERRRSILWFFLLGLMSHVLCDVDFEEYGL